jgi:3-oxoacyl-[acyl-carrier protein] reductase
MNELDFRNRTAVITGGAAGIGLAVARRLAASGAAVALWDRDASALAKASAELGGGAHTQALDVADSAAVGARPTPRRMRSGASTCSCAPPASRART